MNWFTKRKIRARTSNREFRDILRVNGCWRAVLSCSFWHLGSPLVWYVTSVRTFQSDDWLFVAGTCGNHWKSAGWYNQIRQIDTSDVVPVWHPSNKIQCRNKIIKIEQKSAHRAETHSCFGVHVNVNVEGTKSQANGAASDAPLPTTQLCRLLLNSQQSP